MKTFGHTRALDGLDLHVRPGEVHGFLGPNGAGKSGPRVLLDTYCVPTAVRSNLLDGDPWRDAATLHRRLAYVPGDVSLWPNLSGGEVIRRTSLRSFFFGLQAWKKNCFAFPALERFHVLDFSKKGRA